MKQQALRLESHPKRENSAPNARHDGPDSSQRAADAYTESGRRLSHKQMVLAATTWENQTAEQIAAKMPIENRHYPLVLARKRLPDLKREGAVENGEPEAGTRCLIPPDRVASMAREGLTSIGAL